MAKNRLKRPSFFLFGANRLQINNISIEKPYWSICFKISKNKLTGYNYKNLNYAQLHRILSLISQSLNQATIKSRSLKYRIVRKCHRCFNLRSGRFSVTLIWISGHCDIPEICRAHKLARGGTLLPESSSIDLRCHLPRSNWPLRENSSGTPTYPGSC